MIVNRIETLLIHEFLLLNLTHFFCHEYAQLYLQANLHHKDPSLAYGKNLRGRKNVAIEL